MEIMKKNCSTWAYSTWTTQEEFYGSLTGLLFFFFLHRSFSLSFPFFLRYKVRLNKITRDENRSCRQFQKSIAQSFYPVEIPVFSILPLLKFTSVSVLHCTWIQWAQKCMMHDICKDTKIISSRTAIAHCPREISAHRGTEGEGKYSAQLKKEKKSDRRKSHVLLLVIK